MTINRSGVSLSAAFALLTVLPTNLVAQTLPLDFQPPDMVVSPVCVARALDADLIAEWGAWDGVTLPDRDVGLINRDMRRLSELDPVAWDQTIQTVISLLPGVSPGFTEDHVTLARIEHMIAMGRLPELRSSGLVQKLLDRGDENSPRMLNALAGFLSEGIGIERDTKRGGELLMAAGYGGNADALLTLSRRAVSGTAPEGWDVNPQLAATMAFGSLVGQIDPLICDRIVRIAREFSNGDVVSVDHDLAVRWYRFAADLGDPVSAWRVAEYEVQSELVTKDNDVLLTYLTKAADGNLPYAQVALGRVYEAGALVPVDLDKALALYRAAASDGDRAGLIRLSGFVEAQLAQDPTFEAEFLDTLTRLEAQDDAPSWAFAKHAEHILSVQGRWAGLATARPLLEKGVALDDTIAISMLAQLDFGTAKSDAAFYTAVDHLIHAVTTLGDAAPTADLQAAFLCKAPGAPLVEEAAYWAGVEASIGTTSDQFTGPQVVALAGQSDPLAMAALQTQALYGRAAPLANLLEVLDRSGSPPSTVAFWTAYADRSANVNTARAGLALELAPNPAARAKAIDQFRAAVAAGEDGAALKLAKALLVDGTETARAEAATLLIPLAQDGNGEAMALLPSAAAADYPTVRAVFDAFSGQIDARGDFFALMLAFPFLPDATARDTYRARAITAMQCSFPEAIAFSGAMGAVGQPDEARRWLTIASLLAQQNAWQFVELGDSYRALPGADGTVTAMDYYEKAYAMGNRTAVQRLLKASGKPSDDGYDQARVVTLYTDLVAFSDPGDIPAVLTDLARKDAKLRLAVEAKLDLGLLYAEAARAGNPAAMREHAGRLRSAARTSEDFEASTAWLVAASEAGDVAAMVTLSQAYSMGVGVPASLENARFWLEKAAKAGDPTAIDMVKFFDVGTGLN